jgi:hypothetical protein
MEIKELLKNNLFLGLLFIIISILTTISLYYIKNDEDRKSESTIDKCNRSLFPGILLGIVVILTILLLNTKEKTKEKMSYELLDEEFWVP